MSGGGIRRDGMDFLQAAMKLGADATLRKPFRVGHWVTIGGKDGMVSEITWRATKIRTKAGNFVVVPNSVLSRDTITNYSEPTRETRLEPSQAAQPSREDEQKVRVQNLETGASGERRAGARRERLGVAIELDA